MTSRGKFGPPFIFKSLDPLSFLTRIRDKETKASRGETGQSLFKLGGFGPEESEDCNCTWRVICGDVTNGRGKARFPACSATGGTESALEGRETRTGAMHMQFHALSANLATMVDSRGLSVTYRRSFVSARGRGTSYDTIGASFRGKMCARAFFSSVAYP